MKKLIAGFAALTVSALLLTGCAPSEQTLTLVQPSNAVDLEAIDLNPGGDAGDGFVFESPVLNEGDAFGSLVGSMVEVSGLDRGSNPDREERLVSAVFDLPDGQISVLGVSFYQRNEPLLDAGAPMTRAIVGGTGAYKGVTGEVTTTRNEDNSYTHVLQMTR